MNKNITSLLFISYLLFIPLSVFSQEPSDCINSVVVCGNSNLSIDVEGIGTQELSGSNTCGSQENNSIWLEVNIETSGTLGFILTPQSSAITEDYDFFIFGPNVSCGNIGQAIRCSTTNPQAANQGNNLTGMNATETDTSEGPGPDGNSFVRQLDVLAGERYFFVIDRPIGTSPFSIEWTGTSTFPGNPINPVNTDLLNLEICDNFAPFDDGIAEFDLSTLRTDIINGDTDVSVSFHDSESDANINLEPLGDVFNSESGSQIIYARIENISSGCFIINEVNLNVILSPDFNTPTDFMVCDDTIDGDNTNGASLFDFSIKTDEITFGFDANDYAITYHNTSIDAENNVMPLPLQYTTNTPTPTEIFVRIEDLILGCIGFSSFFIEVLPAPTANNSDIFQCDEIGPQDGITIFNLNQLFNEVTGSEPDRSISFFNSLAEAQNNGAAVNADSYSNVSNPEILTVRVENTVTGCVNFSEVTLEVSATAVNNALLTVCDDDGIEDGLHNFNLSNADTDVLNGLPAGLTTVYYANINDALLENEPLPNDYTNTSPFTETIFVRVENDNDCFGINEVQLQVLDIPDIETEFETLYCLNTFPETITLTSGLINGNPNDFFYDWSTGETSSEIQINEPGIYTVRVSNTLGCFADRTITVLPSNIAEITNIEVRDASDNNTIVISVTGEGDYEYALDFINGIYQDSNRFENVTPGFHTVFVRDKNNCGITEEIVSVIGFPKFFTPNGDGNNDSWQVQGISNQFQPSTEIFIFDRYGKLLKQISPTSSGWDGTYNGNLMPTNDYWFSVTLEDGRQFSSHFTLKR